MSTSPRPALLAPFALAAALVALAPPARAEAGVIRDQDGCRFVDPSPKPNERVTWSGHCRDGWGDGPGTLRWLVNGVPTYLYTGTVAAGKLEGEGSENIRGDRYEGHFADGHRQGHGVFTWHDGVRYDGQFVRGQMVGAGALEIPGGARFEGRFVDNLLQAPITLVKTMDGVQRRLPMDLPETAVEAPPLPASAPGQPRIDALADCKPRYPVAALAQAAMGSSRFSLRIEPDGQVSRVRIDHRSGTDFAHQLLDLSALGALLGCPREGAGPGGQAQWLAIEYVWKLE